MGPRAGADGCGKSRPHRDSIPGPSGLSRVAIPTELPQPTLNPNDNHKIPISELLNFVSCGKLHN